MLDPLAPIRIVIIDPSASDPAVDVEAMAKAKDAEGKSQLIRYVETRDEALVIVKQGATPMWFTVEPLAALFQSLVIDPMRSESERRLFAFMASVRCIEAADGKMVPAKLIPGRYGQELCDDEFVERVARRVGLKAIYEAGHVALQRGQLSQEAKGVFHWSRT